MARIVLFNKPYGVICQFSGDGSRPTLKNWIAVPEVYPAGRLDTDSEGLLVLTDDGRVQHRIAHPQRKLTKTYLVQVEGEPDSDALARLAGGVDVGPFVSQPCTVREVAEPEWLWPRDPPVRFRKTVPTAWLEIDLHEGKNRQVRRMTATVGLPTLRLIRIAVGPWRLDGLAPGQWCEVAVPAGWRTAAPAASATRPRDRRAVVKGAAVKSRR